MLICIRLITFFNSTETVLLFSFEAINANVKKVYSEGSAFFFFGKCIMRVQLFQGGDFYLPKKKKWDFLI